MLKIFKKIESQEAQNLSSQILSGQILSGQSLSGQNLSGNWKYFLALTLTIGAILRVMWGADIEYKYDEHFMFERTQRVGVVEPLPALGMASGVGTRNPGMSIWVFLALSKIISADTPPELARGVQILNILALIAFTVFAIKTVPREQKPEWFWAIALASVNPFMIILERKIWAQSVLPIFCCLLIMGWWRRDKIWGAFIWGLIGVLIGQIHMTGFFFTGALFFWTFFFGYDLKVNKKIHYRALLSGGLLGLIPLIPWLIYMFEQPRNGSVFSYLIHLDYHPLLTSSFWQLWITDPLGLGVWYSLGEREFTQFLSYPLVSDQPTYLVALAHMILLALGVFILSKAFIKTWRHPLNWKAQFIGSSSETDFLRSAGMWGYGIFITLLGVFIYRHYMLITFPLEFLWLAQLIFRNTQDIQDTQDTQGNTKKATQALAVIWFCELVVSTQFLSYIHDNHGSPSGDYGVGYQYNSSFINHE